MRTSEKVQRKMGGASVPHPIGNRGSTDWVIKSKCPRRALGETAGALGERWCEASRAWCRRSKDPHKDQTAAMTISQGNFMGQSRSAVYFADLADLD